MRRLTACTAAVLVFLTWSTLAVVNGEKTSLPKPEASRVTIVFRGLMVFHTDSTRQYFEAGVLRAPEHKFRIEVREKSSTGISSLVVPSENTSNDIWSFEFASSTKQGVTFYQNGAFDRKAGIGDERDFRWAVDVEGKEFYNKELTTKQNQLGPVVRVNSAEFYTKTRTLPLLRNKGNGTFEYFGRAADEVAADLFVASGDVVLRSTNSGKEILRLKDKPGTTYEIVIENQYMPETHAGNNSHFRYYYRYITKPHTQWYDFKVADDAVFSAHHAVGKTSYVAPGSNRTPCTMWGFGKRTTPLK